MNEYNIDKEYSEFLLARIWKVSLELNEQGGMKILRLNWFFETIELAHAAMYYLCFRLLKEKIHVSFEVTADNNFITVLDIKDKGIKLYSKVNTFNQLEISNIFSSGKLTYDTDTLIFISFFHPKKEHEGWDSEPYKIWDETFNKGMVTGLTARLYTYGNDGFEVHYGERLPF